jgi:hypothetical protein
VVLGGELSYMPDVKTDNKEDEARAKWLASLYQQPPPSQADLVKGQPRQRAEDFTKAPSDLDSAISTGRERLSGVIDSATPDVVKEALPAGMRLGRKAVDALGDRLREVVTTSRGAGGADVRDKRPQTMDMSWNF